MSAMRRAQRVGQRQGFRHRIDRGRGRDWDRDRDSDTDTDRGRGRD